MCIKFVKTSMSAIPDRWLQYKACGNVIDGTRFICFKVPLKKEVQINKKEIKHIWDISELLRKIPNLGAVIDLTNTHRYYDPRVLQERGVIHKKILMPGRVLPPENRVEQFMNTIDELLEQNCDQLIGVHCTHGLNRTGYMVCRYMRDRLGVPPKVAIKRFEKARGYPMERKVYIDDLLKCSTKPQPPISSKPSKTDNKRGLFNKDSKYSDYCDGRSYNNKTFKREEIRSGNSLSKGKSEKNNQKRKESSNYDWSFDY